MDTTADVPEPVTEDVAVAKPVPLQVLDPRSFRQSRLIEVEIGDGMVVKARKLDLTTMMFEGLISLPLLAAVQRAMESADTPYAQAERIATMDDTDRQAMITLLCRHACKAVVVPTITMTDDGDPDHLPADMLGIEALTAIFAATTVVPVASVPEVARFRERAASIHGTPPPPREDVRPAAEPVGAPAVELTHA